MRTLLAAALIAAGSAAAVAPASAAVYDAFSSFTGTNTGGAFTYGSLDTTGATPVFTAYNDTPGCAGLISDTICTSNGGLPAAFKSTSGAHQSGTVIVPGDALILHPGANDGQDSAILFTVPQTSKITISFGAALADTNPSGVQLVFFIPGVVALPGPVLDASNPVYPYESTIFTNTIVPAGFSLGFAIDKDGVYYNDATAVNFSVTTTAVPEPASWALMVAGFGLVGVAARRRTARTA